jgi:predicted enzyme related to lactoylglutathione lyase
MIRYVHTNLIAKDWRRLADFYQKIFSCVPVQPERDLSGEWLDKATGIKDSHLRGIHLRLPGHGESGPTLEIFQYDAMPGHPEIAANTPGFSHIAFAVDDVESAACSVFNYGGSAAAEMTQRDVPGVGRLTFQYVFDPEGNMIEVQKWEKLDETEEA